MSKAFSVWNPEHDMCAIYWTRGVKPYDIPADAINHALHLMYQDSMLAPFLYIVYENESWVGMLVAGNFNPDNQEQIDAVWSSVRESAQQAPQPEPYQAQEWAI